MPDLHAAASITIIILASAAYAYERWIKARTGKLTRPALPWPVRVAPAVEDPQEKPVADADPVMAEPFAPLAPDVRCGMDLDQLGQYVAVGCGGKVSVRFEAGGEPQWMDPDMVVAITGAAAPATVAALWQALELHRAAPDSEAA